MRARTHRLLLAAGWAAWGFSAFGAPALPQVEKASELRFPPLRETAEAIPQRVVLDNGLTVLLLEDHELPLVDATALIRTGALYESADKVGLAVGHFKTPCAAGIIARQRSALSR